MKLSVLNKLYCGLKDVRELLKWLYYSSKSVKKLSKQLYCGLKSVRIPGVAKQLLTSISRVDKFNKKLSGPFLVSDKTTVFS